MTRVDLVFPASSRPEFTAASLRALADNTDWSLVRRLWLYLDSPSHETVQAIGDWINAGPMVPAAGLNIYDDHFGGPVAIMNHWLYHEGADVMAKIGNDVIVPPGWLNAALAVMDGHPELDLLGLEPPRSRTPAPWANGKRPAAPELDLAAMGLMAKHWTYARCEAIGGVGLMRRRAFANRPRMTPHSTYGGFTDWQRQNPDVVKGWIVPPLNLFLLDRLPIEPWASHSRQYIAEGIQRPWTNYSPDDHELWDWWLA